MKAMKFFLSILIVGLFALTASSQVSLYQFDEDTLTNTDTVYFLYPEIFPESNFTKTAKTWDQKWQIQLENTPDSAVAVAYLETTNFSGSTPTWTPTGDTLALTGNSSGFITARVNARRSRVKVIQTNTTTSYANGAVRTVPYGN